MDPFYDATKSYEENYDQGPFGAFMQNPPELPKTTPVSFLGTTVDIPFGIPAGPLLNSKFVTAAWKWGFSINTYKTVRGNVYPCHPFPNVIKVKGQGPNIHPGDTVLGDLDISHIDVDHDGITNSFAVPSKATDYWMEDAKKALAAQTPGNLMILSFMGTKTEEMTRDTYIEDFARTCRLAKDTGAKVLEVNFSCPNFGKEGLICNDVAMSRDILEALKLAKGNVPLLVKIGYFTPEQQADLAELLTAIKENAEGVAAINTVSAKVVDAEGKQVLPGSAVRLVSGTCGATIRWAGFEMAERLMAVKRQKNWKEFVVVGVGGVTRVEDYAHYRSLGVDAVQSATGAMWKPDLAIQIRKAQG